MFSKLLSVFTLAVAISSCSHTARVSAADNSRAEETEVSSALELPLPQVPPSLTAPQERADYIMLHFWDSMDFGDTLRGRNKEFVELNMANFMSLFPHGSRQGLSQSIGTLLGKTAHDSVSLALVTEIMERYLDEPNSPMRNESHYIVCLEELLRLPGLTDDARIRPAYKLEMARKNRPGTVATDFAYIDRDGRRHTLHNTAEGQRILLLFYDPECEHCSEILRQVDESAVIADCIAQKSLTVLAVYTEGNRALWDETKAAMPPLWSVGYDTDGIVDRDLYAIPAMPVMYLLDKDKKVILKDVFLPEIEAQLIALQ